MHQSAQILGDVPIVLESFIGPAEAAEYLACTERYLLYLARGGTIPAYPIGRGQRKQWRFLRSQLHDWLLGQSRSKFSKRSTGNVQ
jgi:excisionase family DNA binding protein